MTNQSVYSDILWKKPMEMSRKRPCIDSLLIMRICKHQDHGCPCGGRRERCGPTADHCRDIVGLHGKNRCDVTAWPQLYVCYVCIISASVGFVNFQQEKTVQECFYYTRTCSWLQVFFTFLCTVLATLGLLLQLVFHRWLPQSQHHSLMSL